MKAIPRIIFETIAELFFFLAYPLAGLARIFLWLKKDDNRPKNTAKILIVENWFVPSAWHSYMRNYLQKQGFDVYTTNYSLFRGGYDDAAVSLKKYIEKNDLNNLTLVGISLGALPCFIYLQRRDGWEKVKSFISIGCPFRGAPLGVLIAFLKSGRQIIPRSPFLDKLLNEKIKTPHRIICLSAKADQLVPSWSSSLVGVYNETVNVVGHNNLHIRSKRAFYHILKAAKL